MCVTPEVTKMHGVKVSYVSVTASYVQSWGSKQNLPDPKACVENE